jgi:hypothetical protein
MKESNLLPKLDALDAVVAAVLAVGALAARCPVELLCGAGCSACCTAADSHCGVLFIVSSPSMLKLNFAAFALLSTATY